MVLGYLRRVSPRKPKRFLGDVRPRLYNNTFDFPRSYMYGDCLHYRAHLNDLLLFF